jgi:transcriptional regulator with XRE-family HTH domain
MDGPGLLARHLKAKNLTQSAFAEAAGLSSPLISMWLSRRRRPGLKSAVALEAATGGAVPAASWLAKSRPHRRSAAA